MTTIKELENMVEGLQNEVNIMRKEKNLEPITLGVGGAYGKTYIYRDQLFVDNLFSGTKKECELFHRGAYQQRVLQRRDYK